MFNALYSEYKTYCEQDGETLSRWLFRETFESLDSSLYKRKKDRCDTWYSFETGNLSGVVKYPCPDKNSNYT